MTEKKEVWQVSDEHSKTGLGEEGQAHAEGGSKLGWLTSIHASTCTVLAILVVFFLLLLYLARFSYSFTAYYKYLKKLLLCTQVVS